MATMLTDTFQKVSETNVFTSGSYKAYVRVYAKYNSQSKENNQTAITLEQRFWYNQGSSYKYSFGNATAILDGTTKPLGATTYKGSTEYVIQTVNRTINHNQDGTSPIKNVSYSWRDSAVGQTKTGSVDLVVPKIDRYPMLITAPDFNDEDNPTIQYSTTLGFEGASVSAGIFDSTGTNAYVTYKEVNVEQGNYIFELTTSERTALLSASADISTPLPVTYKLKTTYNNVDYISSKQANMSIVNGEPTFTFTTTENNAKVNEVFDTTTYVSNASNKTFTITPSAKKQASITKVEITHNGVTQSKTASPYTFNVNIVSNEVLIKVYDSRSKDSGDTATSLTPYVSYSKVDITKVNVNRPSMTSNNVLVQDLEANYITSFGSISNTATLKYKIDSGSYVTIPSSAYVIANNKITMSSYTITNGLSYNVSGNIEIVLEDKLTSDTETRGIKKGVPTFDYGEHDLQINGDLYVADTDRNNAVNVMEAIDEAKEYGNVYSSDEIEIGKWIDGSTIYRKVIKSVSTYGTGINIAHNISGLKRVIKCDIVASDDNGTSYPAYNTSFVLQVVQINSTNIKMNIASGFGSGWPVYYIMEYTKTTD